MIKFKNVAKKAVALALIVGIFTLNWSIEQIFPFDILLHFLPTRIFYIFINERKFFFFPLTRVFHFQQIKVNIWQKWIVNSFQTISVTGETSGLKVMVVKLITKCTTNKQRRELYTWENNISFKPRKYESVQSKIWNISLHFKMLKHHFEAAKLCI